MINPLKGKTAIVTGASSGIGKATALALLDHGVHVLGLCRNTTMLPSRIEPLSCDLTDTKAIEEAFSKVRYLDILVNNAGIALLSRITDGTPDDWATMWHINVHALTVCCQLALPRFAESGGQIINISSMSGHRVPPSGGFYSPTKFAVKGVTDALRNELRAAGSKTRVATISPGFVNTPLLDTYFKGRKEQLREILAATRMLTPEDVANSVLHTLLTPPHVEITDIQIRSVDQAG